MLRLFSKIRNKLLVNRNISKYLLYAFGEIILVIIGILIALYINNWNQERQQAVKVEMIFNELLKNLETDILNAEEAIVLQEHKDSLIQRVLKDSVTIEDYKRDGYLRNLLFKNRTMSFSNTSYANLVQHIDHIPAAYSHLLPLLNGLYEDHQSDVQGGIDKVHDYVTGTLKKWVNEKPWFSGYISHNKSEGHFDYVLNDPIYKNEIALYKVLLVDNLKRYTIEYHYRATLAYQAIAKAFDKPLPEGVDTYLPAVPVEVLKEYVGSYRMEGNGFVMAIGLEDNQIQFVLNEGKNVFEFWARTENTFYCHDMRTTIKFLVSEEDSSVVGLNYKTTGFNANLVLVDSLAVEVKVETGTTVEAAAEE